jgi:hypothetical protein
LLLSKLPTLSVFFFFGAKCQVGVCYRLIFSFYLEQWSLMCIWNEKKLWFSDW